MTPDRLLRWLLSFPFSGAVSAMQGDELTITLEGEVLRFDGAWRAPDGQRIACTLPDVSNADDIHAEIRRGLAITRGITGASWEQTKEDCVGPDLPADDPLYDRAAAAQALAKVSAERDQARVEVDNLNREAARVQEENERLQDRLTTMSSERDRLLISEDTLSKIAAAVAIPALEPYDDALSMVKRLVDGYAVVSQRLVGAQKEVAEVTAQRDEIAAAHSTLHTESEARRRADLRAVKAFTTIAEVFGVDPADVGKVCEVVAAQRRRVLELERERDDATARADKVEDRLRRDDDLRSAIAVAVGLDGSASLALILDTVTRDRPAPGLNPLSGLLDALAAPVAFGGRRLSTAARAEFVLGRLGEVGAEADKAMVVLDGARVPAFVAAAGDGPEEMSLRLSLSERLRLHFGARS